MERTLRSIGHKALISELRSARKRAGFTQARLARLLNQPQSFIAKIENGERRVDVIEVLIILNTMNVPWKRVLARVDQALSVRKGD